MKTAMQELIEWCNNCLTDLTLSDGAKTALEVTIVRATDLLEDEKWQIINAVNNGDSTNFWVDFDSAEDYYNETYTK